MTLDESLQYADRNVPPAGQIVQTALIVNQILSAEVRRLQVENASLRLYSPARRATETVKTDPVGECNDEYWRLAHETDAEFEAWGNEYTEVAQ